MLSRAHISMRKQLSVISRMYKVPVLEEVKEGDKRYDFYFPTSKPIVIEVDGDNHNQNKADGFFFKTTEQLIRYKKNDMEREKFNILGKIILLRYTDKEFPSFSEILDDLKEVEAILWLEQGVDENNAYYKRVEYDKRKSEERKRKNREFRKKIQQKYNNGNRPK